MRNQLISQDPFVVENNEKSQLNNAHSYLLAVDGWIVYLKALDGYAVDG